MDGCIMLGVGGVGDLVLYYFSSTWFGEERM